MATISRYSYSSKILEHLLSKLLLKLLSIDKALLN